jgi:HEPN domain-containing protein
MRPETEPWWRQAHEDLLTAELNFQIQRFYAAAWFVQQAVEKGLKALYLERHAALPPKIHNLEELGSQVSAPVDVETDLSLLNPIFWLARYPDSRQGTAPIDQVSEARAKGYIEAGRRTLQWLDQQLSFPPNQP